MKKLLFSFIACCILVAPLAAQNAKPSKKELLKMWSAMPAEGQAKLLAYSKQVSQEYAATPKAVATPTPVVTAETSSNNTTSNQAKSVEPRKNANQTPPTVATTPSTNRTAPAPATPIDKNTPAPSRITAKPATENNSTAKTTEAAQAPQSKSVEPKRPAVTVTPADAVKPVNSNVVSTMPPAKTQAAPAATPVPNPEAKPADTRPEYQIKAESMAKTTIQWDSDKFEFGKIKQGDVTNHAFRFKNTGTNPLQLTYVRPSCGCTATNWTKEVIPPGGEGMVEINFNSTGKSGQQHKVVTVFANTEPIMQNLQFTGDVFVPDAGSTPAPAHDSHEGHNH